MGERKEGIKRVALLCASSLEDRLSHRCSISIIEDMTNENQIEAKIVKDMYALLGKDAQMEKEPENAKLMAKRWRCNVCGYIHEGDTSPSSCQVAIAALRNLAS